MTDNKPFAIHPGAYQLIMTKDHVQFLVDVLSMVGGVPATSRRGLGDEIRRVLIELDSSLCTTRAGDMGDGSVEFIENGVR